MRVVVQKCSRASCIVNNKVVGSINNGLMLLVGFTLGDNEDTLDYMVKKIVNLRIFEDDNNVMNKSLLDVKGEILSISQFTLYADTKKGNRPSYINALNSEQAIVLYDMFNKKLNEVVHTETGIFGEDMSIDFVNIGPTTICLEK